MLPYRGHGSGVPRAIESWPKIDFRGDRDGNLVAATVMRDPTLIEKTSVKSSDDEPLTEKTSVKILSAVSQNPDVTIPQLAQLIDVTSRSIKRNLKRLQEQDRIQRVGPDKGGKWEVIVPGLGD